MIKRGREGKKFYFQFKLINFCFFSFFFFIFYLHVLFLLFFFVYYYIIGFRINVTVFCIVF